MHTITLRIAYDGSIRIVEGEKLDWVNLASNPLKELAHRGWQITGVSWLPSVEAIDYTLQKKPSRGRFKVVLNYATGCTEETFSSPGTRDIVVEHMGVNLQTIDKYHQQGYILASVELPHENIIVYEFRYG